MVVEAKFETMITNDSCFVAVSCLVVFCCWKLNYSSFHISPFFPVSSISFSKVQIMITTTSRRPPAYTNFIGTNRKLNLKKSFEKRGYFWNKIEKLQSKTRKIDKEFSQKLIKTFHFSKTLRLKTSLVVFEMFQYQWHHQLWNGFWIFIGIGISILKFCYLNS